MIDFLRFLLPNASAEYLTSTSNAMVLFGWFFVSLGLVGFFMESIGQRRLVYEAFPLILAGLFLIVPLGMHTDISVANFFEIIISLPIVLG